MAWKKLINKDDMIQWYQEDSKTSVFVYLQDYIDTNKKSHYVFEVHKNGQTLIEKDFTTKKQATDKAKEYMRKH